jgi:two-component system, OmpR family, sensor kinase
MFRSIRWNLLIWQTAILVAVVVGFGAALWLRVRHATLEQVDADLLGAAQVVVTQLQQSGSARQLGVPAAYRQRFGTSPADAPYLVVWDAAGRVKIASDVAPADFPPVPEPPATDYPRPFYERSRGPFREVILRGPSDWRVLVGRQIGRERNELIRLLWWLLGTGIGIVALGLTAACLLAARILTPVEQMTRIAEQISASNLSERIDESRIKSELGRLAQVLNRTFGRLQAAFERQARFTADASHELRTPTAVVLAQSELALARQRSPQEYQEALRACYRAAKRMEALVDGLLTLARMDSGQLEMHREPVDLRQVVEQSVGLLKPLADQRRIRLTYDLQRAQVTGDAERLGQVVANLVSNAVTYNREGGEVRLHLVAEKQAAVLTVVDTGIGIEEDDLSKIFERFYRADRARTGNSGGIGLGLAICREIVRSHGGAVEVASVLDEGTTFTVRLPLLEPRSSHPQDSSSCATDLAGGIPGA